MHTFEISGLGKAPFSIANSTEFKKISGEVFWCEHCGTILVNRFLVKSSDGKLSVVGIDCLKKTGDRGIVDGAKAIQKAARKKVRDEAWILVVEAKHAEQREINGGKTHYEMSDKFYKKRDKVIATHSKKMESNAVVEYLDGDGFESDMCNMAMNAKPFSNNQVRIIAEIMAKKSTNSRKNSKAYAEALPNCQVEVMKLQKIIVKAAEKAEENRSMALSYYTKV
jgi:hypothetical protein